MIHIGVIDDSEAVRLRKLLEDNGFDVADLEVQGFNGELTRMVATVYPKA